MNVNNWSIRVITPGETYGRRNQLLHDEPTPLIEFRDMSNFSPEQPYGIVASRLNLDLLIGKEGKDGLPNVQALLLDAGIPKWRLSADEMYPILSFLRLKEAEISKEKSHELTNKIRAAEHRCADHPSGNTAHVRNEFPHQGGAAR